MKLCGLLATILDEARVCEREARYDFKRTQEEKGQMPKWPVDCRGVYREVRPVVYNKAIFKLRATSLDKKAICITPEIEIEALTKQRVDRSNGNTPEQHHDKHNEAKAGGWENKGNRGTATRGCRKRQKHSSLGGWPSLIQNA